MQSKYSCDQLAECAKKHDYVLETERDYERFYLTQNALQLPQSLLHSGFNPAFGIIPEIVMPYRLISEVHVPDFDTRTPLLLTNIKLLSNFIELL